ncbi:hypothetical protein [Massilia cavernae]|uniref:hypothetical protein n=1 Tax=Massilia cavernae TaxID=2320864 RepID=UPI00160407B4|nr:hypothetical protein [Massilia cavernae]
MANANSAVRGEGGKIILKASGDTLLEAGSVTSATGAGKGGQVSVLGERVALLGGARIDASGTGGGGTVLVGGDYQGKSAAVLNARQTWMGKDASIRADAGESNLTPPVIEPSNPGLKFTPPPVFNASAGMRPDGGTASMRRILHDRLRSALEPSRQ